LKRATVPAPSAVPGSELPPSFVAFPPTIRKTAGYSSRIKVLCTHNSARVCVCVCVCVLRHALLSSPSSPSQRTHTACAFKASCTSS
jgi:hypothetical protein